MDVAKLKKLLAQKEGPKLDYKLTMPLASDTHKKEIAKDVLALANTPGGRGYLVIGVQDKTRTLVGVDPLDYPEERIQQILLTRCDPPVNVSVDPVHIQGVVIVVISVYKSHNRPHQMRQTGAFYIRRGSTTDLAHRDEIALMFQHAGLIVTEQMPLYHGRMSHFDLGLVEGFVMRMTGQAYREGDENLLCDLGLMFYEQEDNRYYPTVGGLLLFGKDPQVLMPHTGIKFITLEPSGNRIQTVFRGAIIPLLDQAMQFCEKILDGTDYPLDILEEAISNALVHRDYFDNSREIVVFISDKRIEISNPGAIADHDPLNNMIRSVTPKRRNAWLYHQLLTLDGKNRFTKYGLGLLKIKRAASVLGNVRFINLRKSNLFKVVLPGLENAHQTKGPL